VWQCDINFGASTVAHLKLFDLHCCGWGTNSYLSHFSQELESRWPVAELGIRRGCPRSPVTAIVLLPSRTGF
jgi:hypothetical protein